MAAEAVGAHAHVCRLHPLRDEAMLCAIRGTGRTLDFALRAARETGCRLYLLYLREQAFMTEHDARRKWPEDPEAWAIFEKAKALSPERPPLFCYAVSESASQTIVDIAATLGASRLILGAPGRHAMTHLLPGNLVREVFDISRKRSTSSSTPEQGGGFARMERRGATRAMRGEPDRDREITCPA